MRKGWGAMLSIGLSNHGATILKIRRHWRAPAVDILEDVRWTVPGDELTDRLATQLRTLLANANCTGFRTRVVLADDMVRFFTVTPPHNARNLGDCRAAAEMRFQSLYGESSVEWRLNADWHARHPFLACAIPTALINAIQQTASEQKLALVEIVPHFVSTWNQYRHKMRPDSWFGVAHDGSITFGVTDRQRLSAVRRLALALDAYEAAHWQEILVREALLLSRQMPKRLQLLDSTRSIEASQEAGGLTIERIGTGGESMPAIGTAGVMLARAGLAL